MFILQYHYFKRNPDTLNPIGNPIFKQCSGMKLSAVMDTYRAGSLEHDLYKYTPRTIDNIINTDEQ